MDINSAFPSKWIRASDLQGRDITLTILRCLEEEVAGDGSTQPVIYFNGTKKGLALNKTNANIIAEAFGRETDVWLGEKITLYPTKTDFKGDRVDCIRVREQPPAQPAIPLPATPLPAAPLPEEPETAPASAPNDGEIPF